MRGDALKHAVDAAVSDRQAEAASRAAQLRDAQTQAAGAEARLQTVRPARALPSGSAQTGWCERASIKPR